MKIVVLGGTGFVGESVVEELTLSDYRPISLSRRNGLDLMNLEKSRQKIYEIKPDVIINCAANVGSLHYVTEFAADVIHDNSQMILNIYRIVKDVCPDVKIINPVANCSYPGELNIYIEENYWNGPVHDSVWSYGNSRRSLVIISKCYHIQYGIKSINFIVPNAYGPGDSLDPYKTHALNGLVIRMLKAKKLNNKDFDIWGSGKPIREWIFVKDIARIFKYAIENINLQIEPINLAQNTGYSIKEIAQIIKNLINYNGNLVFNTKYQDGALKKIMDDKLFREKVGNFVFTDLEIGIAETVKFYEDN